MLLRKGRQGYQIFRQKVLVSKMRLVTRERIINWQIKFRVRFTCKRGSSVKEEEGRPVLWNVALLRKKSDLPQLWEVLGSNGLTRAVGGSGKTPLTSPPEACVQMDRWSLQGSGKPGMSS